MAENREKANSPFFSNPMETFPGLTIDDLNRYLPAVKTVEDIMLGSDKLSEGMFLSKCLDGLKKVPDESIDLIVANPLNQGQDSFEFGNGKTLQDYYQQHKWFLRRLFRAEGGKVNTEE